VASFVKQAKKLQLAFDVTLSLPNSDPVYPQLNVALLHHMHESSFSFSSTIDSSSQLSSPATPSSSYAAPLWTFLTSERTARSTHKGAILKLYKNPPSSLSFAEFNKLCEHWPKVPSFQDMQPERKLIFIGMSPLCNISLLFSCSLSTHHWCCSWSRVSSQHSPW
jgi:hypothetical protein